MVTQPQDVEDVNDFPSLLPQRSLETTNRNNKISPWHDSLRPLQTVFSLWQYMIPLFVVYMAEYMMQAGVWPAIGFPVTSTSAIAQFYHYANWTYQVGAFLFRSLVIYLLFRWRCCGWCHFTGSVSHINWFRCTVCQPTKEQELKERCKQVF